VIPATFAYERPATLDEALGMLAGNDGSTRPIAGGQSLLPLMKLRLARPERLIDIGRLDELSGIRHLDDGRFAIGALTTWSDLLADVDVMAHGALRDAIPTIGDVAIRNRGTLAGSLAHADPAADIAAAVLALDAELVVRSARGVRTLPANELFVGPFATALSADELIIEVRLPAAASAIGSAYAAVAHPASGFPIAGVAVVLRGAGVAEPGASRSAWSAVAVGVTGVGERPYRAPSVEEAVLGGTASGEAVVSIWAGQRVLADPYADREYRSAMASVVARRALDLATARLGG
jgi:carbon-monoxide dehydrogenase medium subunit